MHLRIKNWQSRQRIRDRLKMIDTFLNEVPSFRGEGGVFRKWPFSFRSGKKGVEMSKVLKNQHLFSLRLRLQRGGTSFRKVSIILRRSLIRNTYVRQFEKSYRSLHCHITTKMRKFDINQLLWIQWPMPIPGIEKNRYVINFYTKNFFFEVAKLAYLPTGGNWSR